MSFKLGCLRRTGRAFGSPVQEMRSNWANSSSGVKSLIFRAERSDRAVLVLASGSNRVDEAAVAALLGEPIARADPEFVRTRTGFAIGGVSPVGHLEPLPTFIDEDLLQYDTLWAAAGTPNAVFKLTPDDLVRLTGGRVARVKVI